MKMHSANVSENVFIKHSSIFLISLPLSLILFLPLHSHSNAVYCYLKCKSQSRKKRRFSQATLDFFLIVTLWMCCAVLKTVCNISLDFNFSNEMQRVKHFEVKRKEVKLSMTSKCSTKLQAQSINVDYKQMKKKKKKQIST